MRPLPDRLNDRLENQTILRRNKEQFGHLQAPVLPSSGDPEVDELAELAQHLQVTSHLQVEPDFAQRLEARMLAHHVAHTRRRATQSRGNWLASYLLRPQFAFGIALIVLLLIGATGVLTAAAQVTNPHNLLYSVKRWEQHVQYSLTTSSVDRAELDWQIAHDQLKVVANLADSASAPAYRQAIEDLDQQINTLAQAVEALPAGQDHDRMQAKSLALTMEARQILRGLLPQLALSEKQLTTDELGRLDDTVPRVESAVVIVSLHPKEQATISLTGENILSGAKLLVDNRLIDVIGTFHDGKYVFTMSWQGRQVPKTLGVLNPDGTVAQTSAITYTLSDVDGNNNGNSGGNNNTGTNSGSNNNNHGHGNSGNGNGGANPVATATKTP